MNPYSVRNTVRVFTRQNTQQGRVGVKFSYHQLGLNPEVGQWTSEILNNHLRAGQIGQI